MCGIFLAVSSQHGLQDPQKDTTNNFENLCRKLRNANSARGEWPDACDEHNISIMNKDGSSGVRIHFFASELQLRGEAPVIQPHRREGKVLCWNGEIFDGLQCLSGPLEQNDGAVLFEALSRTTNAEEVSAVFGGIEGPYAFTFYDVFSGHLYFGRDPLGRRSLLIHKPTNSCPYLLLSSVSAGADPLYSFEELDTSYIYSLDINRLSEQQSRLDTKYAECLYSHSRICGTVVGSSFFACPPLVNINLPPTEFPSVQSLDSIPSYLELPVNSFLEHLDRSVMLQVHNIPPVKKHQARLAVLFSGGIDSTIIAYLAHRHVPLDEPIDLLNVAFENPRKVQLQKEGNIGALPKRQKKIRAHILETSPDRMIQADELRRLCPQRVWNFVEVNVPFEETQATRELIEDLMNPGKTVMDLSLALALYFASKGIGRVKSPTDILPRHYTSAAKVLLNGLGSDELLGGYGRHRTAFQTGGWTAVINELQLEIDRIPTRNLGRDDRVISSHGKEARHPFLSLSVVDFLASLPVHYKLDPRLELGVGDKLLLRLLCQKLGLKEASGRKKRAMQFGSHSARMEGERRGDAII
ncbi:asparagine synthase-domain-containing protein [Cyathus striatus]|nr:asparagine synthase-domain-containing protein [Cyathus striatus]